MGAVLFMSAAGLDRESGTPKSWSLFGADDDKNGETFGAGRASWSVKAPVTDSDELIVSVPVGLSTRL